MARVLCLQTRSSLILTSELFRTLTMIGIEGRIAYFALFLNVKAVFIYLRDIDLQIHDSESVIINWDSFSIFNCDGLLTCFIWMVKLFPIGCIVLYDLLLSYFPSRQTTCHVPESLLLPVFSCITKLFLVVPAHYRILSRIRLLFRYSHSGLCLLIFLHHQQG